MGYNLAANTTICSQIKAAYFKVILPFEDYVKKAKKNGKSKAVAYDSFQKTEDDESSEPARTAVQKKVENAKAVQEGKRELDYLLQLTTSVLTIRARSSVKQDCLFASWWR